MTVRSRLDGIGANLRHYISSMVIAKDVNIPFVFPPEIIPREVISHSVLSLPTDDGYIYCHRCLSFELDNNAIII